jgi:acetolactate synthase-1/2/3 large subunit
MTAMELGTAAQYNIGVKALIMNNEQSGMVTQWQDLFYNSRYSHSLVQNPDFVKLANALGVYAIRCETPEDLPAKMKEFLEYDGDKPILLECIVDKTEHVYPMVVAGKPLHEQVMHPLLREAYKNFGPKIRS